MLRSWAERKDLGSCPVPAADLLIKYFTDSRANSSQVLLEKYV